MGRICAGWVMTHGDDAGRIDPRVYAGLAGFRSALRQFLAFSEAAASEAGVTSQQYQTLLVIKTHAGGRVMIKDIADQMLLQPHGAVQLVDRLAAAELVERQSSRLDRRSVLVALTAKGEQILAQLAGSHLAELLKHESLLADSLRRLRELAR